MVRAAHLSVCIVTCDNVGRCRQGIDRAENRRPAPLTSFALLTKLLVSGEMKISKTVPTDLELEILKVIWERGQGTVREVFQDLLKQRKIAYTTVLTMMGVLERKGHLTKEAGERAYVYTPTVPQDEMVKTMVDEFVGRVFNGSAQPLLVHLVGDKRIDPRELAEVEKLV